MLMERKRILVHHWNLSFSFFLQIVLKHQKAVAFSVSALAKNVYHSVVTLDLLHYQNSNFIHCFFYLI